MMKLTKKPEVSITSGSKVINLFKRLEKKKRVILYSPTVVPAPASAKYKTAPGSGMFTYFNGFRRPLNPDPDPKHCRYKHLPLVWVPAYKFLSSLFKLNRLQVKKKSKTLDVKIILKY